MKPSFKISNIEITSEDQSTGRKETLNFNGIEVECELSLQEMIQLHRDGAVAGDRLMRFIRGELPDMIRNCGKAFLEVKELQQKQELVHREQKFLLKQRIKARKAERKTEDQKE